MAGPSVAAPLQLECHISVSQEELLANLGGGWERSGHYVLDETPSQNMLNLNAEPLVSHEGESGSETSGSVDGDGNMEFTQEPVEWISPSSSPRYPERADGTGRMIREDSYNAAFESDRSHSLSPIRKGGNERRDSEGQISNLGMSVEFITQPASGAIVSQLAPCEDQHNRTAMQGTSPQVGSQLLQLLPDRLSSESLSLRNGLYVHQARHYGMESSMQPFTQPAVGSQPADSTIEAQELASHMQPASERVEFDQDVQDVVKEKIILDMPESSQQAYGRDKTPKNTGSLKNESGGLGLSSQLLQLSGRDKTLGNSRLPDNDRCISPLPNQLQQENTRHEIVDDIPHSGNDASGTGLQNEAQVSTESNKVAEVSLSDLPRLEHMRRDNGNTESLMKKLKRVISAEELTGRQKMQKVEASPMRNRSSSKTVMDVVRSRSRSLSDSLVEDEFNILSIFMRTGVTFPPTVHEKRFL